MKRPAVVWESVRQILLVRRGLAFVSSTGHDVLDSHLRALELELADLGYVLSHRLRARLARTSLDELADLRKWALRVLAEARGADRKHQPLFRRFPAGIPADTEALWWQKVLAHFLQAEGQPCLFCRRSGTTHALSPCAHVICDRCFDGANYSACPVCEHHVNRTSPFFKPSPERPLSPSERVTFQLLDLGEDFLTEARALFVSYCQRTQPLSPDDRAAYLRCVIEMPAQALTWVPDKIPVRENVALVFASLFGRIEARAVLPVAARHLRTATDVLRFLAVFSGSDASLQKETHNKPVILFNPDGTPRADIPPRLQAIIERSGLLEAVTSPRHAIREVIVPLSVHRFKMARLSRPLRRSLLSLMEAMPPTSLKEDMLRHRAYWVWAGQFLHPSEYAARFPNVADAFALVRRKAKDGTRPPRFRTFYSRVEDLAATKQPTAMASLLAERPGELARRLDHALRLAVTDSERTRILATFTGKLPALSTPLLVGLRAFLSTRSAPSPRRVFWPKGRLANGTHTADKRPVLPPSSIAAATSAIESELLARLSRKPAFETAIVDRALASILVPFNERTAASSAVALPRGSRVPVPEGKSLRLFLHWCQPEGTRRSTDLDLSVAFYDADWEYRGVCSYLARTSAPPASSPAAPVTFKTPPFPDGATELVDIDRATALAEGLSLRGRRSQRLFRPPLRPARARLRRCHAPRRHGRRSFRPAHSRSQVLPHRQQRCLPPLRLRPSRLRPSLARRPLRG
ncbi:MAG: MXAN_6230/SCO0854 family RING domain-containing protein [Polyangiaceae bacterium]